MCVRPSCAASRSTGFAGVVDGRACVGLAGGDRPATASRSGSGRSSAAALSIACALGAYLFYAQHNYPGMTLRPRETWDYVHAALDSSSYIPMNPVMAYSPGTSDTTACTI